MIATVAPARPHRGVVSALVALASPSLRASARGGRRSTWARVAARPGEGGSATTFTLAAARRRVVPGRQRQRRLPGESYMVPAAVDPTTVTYDGTGPDPVRLRRATPTSGSRSTTSRATRSSSAQTADAAGAGRAGPDHRRPRRSTSRCTGPASCRRVATTSASRARCSTRSSRSGTPRSSSPRTADDEPAQIRWPRGAGRRRPLAGSTCPSAPSWPAACGRASPASACSSAAARRSRPPPASMEDA